MQQLQNHRFIGGGHTLDFTNKALEALDIIGWNDKELVTSVLSSLVPGYADAERMEESSSWRYPIDLVAILENAFKELPNILEEGRAIRDDTEHSNEERENISEIDLIDTLLGDDPKLIVDVLLDALKQGMFAKELAGTVTYATALRIAQFNTRNEFTDWDAALHTFTFANAVHQCLRRVSASAFNSHEIESQYSTDVQLNELIRGIFDAPMRVYLNRFLNIPPAPIPNLISSSDTINNFDKQNTMEEKLSLLLDKQQQVDAVTQLVAHYYGHPSTENSNLFMNLIGRLLLREDRSFHLIQMIEAALKQCSTIDRSFTSSTDRDKIKEYHFILPAVRYLVHILLQCALKHIHTKPLFNYLQVRTCLNNVLILT